MEAIGNRIVVQSVSTVVTVSTPRNLAFIGGLSLVAATVLFVAVFSYLASAFDYPAVLGRPAGDVLANRFETANLYLGNVIGEFVGELFWNGFLLASSLALAAGPPRRRWLAIPGIGVSTLGWVAMLRNLTPLVGPVATLNNLVLPLWMMTLGVVLLARSRHLQPRAEVPVDTTSSQMPE